MRSLIIDFIVFVPVGYLIRLVIERLKGILKMQSTHILKVKYMPATDTRGERTKIESGRFEEAIYLDYSYKFDSSLDQALAWLEKAGFNVIGVDSNYKDAFYIACGPEHNLYLSLKKGLENYQKEANKEFAKNKN